MPTRKCLPPCALLLLAKEFICFTLIMVLRFETGLITLMNIRDYDGSKIHNANMVRNLILYHPMCYYFGEIEQYPCNQLTPLFMWLHLPTGILHGLQEAYAI